MVWSAWLSSYSHQQSADEEVDSPLFVHMNIKYRQTSGSHEITRSPCSCKVGGRRLQRVEDSPPGLLRRSFCRLQCCFLLIPKTEAPLNHIQIHPPLHFPLSPPYSTLASEKEIACARAYHNRSTMGPNRLKSQQLKDMINNNKGEGLLIHNALTPPGPGKQDTNINLLFLLGGLLGGLEKIKGLGRRSEAH